jgi:hypothetical protein
LTLRVPAHYLIIFSLLPYSRAFGQQRRPTCSEKRWTGIRPMYSPARVNKLLAYPRANADNPIVPPDQRQVLIKLPRNLCVLIKEQSVFWDSKCHCSSKILLFANEKRKQEQYG